MPLMLTTGFPMQDLEKKLKKKTAKANDVLANCDIFFNDNPISANCASFEPLRMSYLNLQRRSVEKA